MNRLSASLLISAFCTIASAQQLKLPRITRTTLDNGIRVVLMEYHRAPALAVRAVFRGGTAYDPPEKAGLSRLMADLITQGTARSTANGIADQIDFLGGSLGASAANDSITVALDILARDVDAGLKLYAEVIRTPAFPHAEFDRRKQLALAGLRSLSEDPDAVADRLAAAVAFGSHPYGRRMSEASVLAITRDDVMAAYQAQIQPGNMIITAVGDFKAATMLAKLRKTFGDWPKTSTVLPKVPKVTASKTRVVVVDKPDMAQTQVRLTRAAMPITSPDYYAAEIAAAALGGGFTSRLVDEVRVNQALTYSVESPFIQMMHGGSFTVTTFTKSESTKALLDAVNGVLSKVAKSGFTATELKRIKGYLVGSFAGRVQTPESLAGQLAIVELYGLPPNYLEQYLQKINAVTLTQLNKVAKTYFDPSKLSLVLVAPWATVKPQLGGLKNVETVSLASVGK